VTASYLNGSCIERFSNDYFCQPFFSLGAEKASQIIRVMDADSTKNSIDCSFTPASVNLKKFKSNAENNVSEMKADEERILEAFQQRQAS